MTRSGSDHGQAELSWSIFQKKDQEDHPMTMLDSNCIRTWTKHPYGTPEATKSPQTFRTSYFSKERSRASDDYYYDLIITSSDHF
jgi:hypothetical protein